MSKEFAQPATDGVRYPGLTFCATRCDSNAFSLIGGVERILKAGRVSPSERKAFRDEAMSGDYDNVLKTMLRWVTVR